MKKYQIKTYNIDWSYKETINPNDVLNEISFSSNVNWGVGQLSIQTNYKVTERDYKWGEFVKVWLYDDFHKEGKQIYFWYISQIETVIDSSREYTTFICLGVQGLLNNIFFTNGSQTKTPSTMIKDVLTLFQWSYNCITEWDIDESVTDTQNYNWSYTTCFDVIKSVCDGTWNKFYVDGEWKLSYFKEWDSHLLHLHYDISQLKITDTIEDVVNNYYLARYGWTVAQYQDETSIATYGRKDLYESNTWLNSANTQQLYGNQYIADHKNPKETISIVLNTKYPFEDIKPGDKVTVLNSEIELKNKVVNKISYKPDQCVLTIDKTDTLRGVIE